MTQMCSHCLHAAGTAFCSLHIIQSPSHSGSDCIETEWHGSGRVGSGRVGSGRVGSGWLWDALIVCMQLEQLSVAYTSSSLQATQAVTVLAPTDTWKISKETLECISNA